MCINTRCDKKYIHTETHMCTRTHACTRTHTYNPTLPESFTLLIVLARIDIDGGLRWEREERKRIETYCKQMESCLQQFFNICFTTVVFMFSPHQLFPKHRVFKTNMLCTNTILHKGFDAL